MRVVGVSSARCCLVVSLALVANNEVQGDEYPHCGSGSTDECPLLLPNYPRDDASCTAEMWESFASQEGYDGSVKMLDSVAHLMWNVVTVSDDNMTSTNNETDITPYIDGKLVFNGIFGYLAIGLAKEDGYKNGMHGASVIMALPGGEYSPTTGIDLDMNTTIKEYVIAPDAGDAAFRHWSDAIEPAIDSEYSIESTDCFTALTFKTRQINGIEFNIEEGEDTLLWSANPTDSYVGYHGSDNRGVFKVNWQDGTGYTTSEEHLDDGHGHEGDDEDEEVKEEEEEHKDDGHGHGDEEEPKEEEHKDDGHGHGDDTEAVIKASEASPGASNDIYSSHAGASMICAILMGLGFVIV